MRALASRDQKTKVTMLNRALTLDERVRQSELFPRIRDAEREMVQNEADFQKKREQQKKRREKQHSLDLKALAMKESAQATQETHYFTGFVLNKDPSCSQYMPFDEIFFPKLFNKVTQKTPPEAIDSLWMLGFEDHIQRVNQPKGQFVQAVAAMDTSTVGSPSNSKTKEKKTTAKKKHKFVAIYSQKPLVV
jgi:hypothetical protein